MAAAPQKAQKLAGHVGRSGRQLGWVGRLGWIVERSGVARRVRTVGSAARSSTAAPGLAATSAGAAAGAAAGLVGAAKGAVDAAGGRRGVYSMADRASAGARARVRHADGSMAARAAHAVRPRQPAPSAPDRSETPDGGPPIGPPPPPKAR